MFSWHKKCVFLSRTISSCDRGDEIMYVAPNRDVFQTLTNWFLCANLIKLNLNKREVAT